jgi:hypothetical protein
MMKKISILLFITFFSANVIAQVTLGELNELKTALSKAFQELKVDANDQLMINREVPGFLNYWWSLDTVYASYALTDYPTYNEHNIYLFGGFIRLPGMTLDGLALTACHEIGHGIAGPPFKVTGASAEGQADYYATRYCLPIVFKYLKDGNIRTQNNYVHNLCGDQVEKDHCLRLFTAIESDIIFFRHLGTETSLETRSNVEVQSVDHSSSFYPEPQCRLDTMVNGALKLPRPSCWFPEIKL